MCEEFVGLSDVGDRSQRSRSHINCTDIFVCSFTSQVKDEHFDKFVLFDKSQLWRAAKVYVSAVAADAGSEEQR